MKLAAKQAELAACPYVSDEAKTQLESRCRTACPPGDAQQQRHQSRSRQRNCPLSPRKDLLPRARPLRPACATRQPLEEVSRRWPPEVAAYKVDYVGLDLAFDGMAVACATGDAESFRRCVEAVRAVNHGDLILMSDAAAVLEAGLAAADWRYASTLHGQYGELAGNGRGRQTQQSAIGGARQLDR